MQTQMSSVLSLEAYKGIHDTILVYTGPRLHTTNVNRSNKRKWFHTKKDKK